jgi:hypothetical protein
MSRPLIAVITIVSLASIVGLGTVANTFGADRIPVSSVDDTSLSRVNRIAAANNVVVDAIHPPSPCFNA